MAQVFISYSRKDLSFVEQLAQDLKRAGLEVWYDLSRLEIGERWSAEITNAIRNSDYVVAVLSPDSVESQWVEREILYAGNLKKRIVPIMVRECELPLNYLNLHCLNVVGENYRNNFNSLMQALHTDPVTLATARRSANQKPVSKRNLSLPLIGCLAVVGLACLAGVIAAAIALPPLWPATETSAAGLPVTQPLLTDLFATQAPGVTEPSVGPTSDVSGTLTVIAAAQDQVNTQSAGQTAMADAATQLFNNTQSAFAALTVTARSDVDGDGLSFTEEMNRGTDPSDPDTDNDQLNDGREISLGTNPNLQDSDGDGIMDGLDPNPKATETPTPLPLCAKKTVSYNPTSTQLTFTSKSKTKGDADFGGNGPHMTVTVHLRPTFISSTRFVFNLEIHLVAAETKSDWTTFDDDFVVESFYVIDIQSGSIFDDWVSRLDDILEYTDFDQGDQDVVPLANLDGFGPVKSGLAIGDTSGNDLGKTKAVITFKALQVKIKQSGGCSP